MPFKRIQTNDQNLSLIQDSVEQALNFPSTILRITSSGGQQITERSQTGAPYISGNLIQIALTAGQDNLVPHGLNRSPVVWTIARLDTNATIWEVVTSKIQNSSGVNASANSTFINLWCSSSCTITLWIN